MAATSTRAANSRLPSTLLMATAATSHSLAPSRALPLELPIRLPAHNNREHRSRTAKPVRRAPSSSSRRLDPHRLSRPHIPGLHAFGSVSLALLLLFGIPAHRRGWPNLFRVVILLVSIAGLGACGDGSRGGGGGGGGGTSDTTAGTYTFTVTGNGTRVETPAPPTTFTLTVN